MEAEQDMIDIHAHILPALDDGPRWLDESLQMCELYIAEEVTTVVATPHLGDPQFPVLPRTVRKGVEALARACYDRGLRLQILPGGDVRLEPELLSQLQAGQILTLGDAGTHLLIELPAQTVPPVEGLLLALLKQGVTPVLSHPERNLELQRRANRLAQLVRLGCLTQLTAGSLLGHFGKWATLSAERFLEAGLVHAVATDAHSAWGPRRPALRQAAQRLCQLVGGSASRQLLYENPARMIGLPGLHAASSQPQCHTEAKTPVVNSIR